MIRSWSHPPITQKLSLQCFKNCSNINFFFWLLLWGIFGQGLSVGFPLPKLIDNQAIGMWISLMITAFLHPNRLDETKHKSLIKRGKKKKKSPNCIFICTNWKHEVTLCHLLNREIIYSVLLKNNYVIMFFFSYLQHMWLACSVEHDRLSDTSVCSCLRPSCLLFITFPCKTTEKTESCH